MIKLTSLIPEIKIQPNTGAPKIGKIYNINHKWMFSVEDEWSEWEIVDIDEDGILLWSVSGIGKTFISEKEFREGLKLGKIKFIRQDINEIKIQPNTNEPQIGDQIKFSEFDNLGNRKGGGGTYEIISLKENGDLFLKHINGEGKFSMSVGTCKNMIKHNEIQLIKKQNIREIKIQPNVKIRIGTQFKIPARGGNHIWKIKGENELNWFIEPRVNKSGFWPFDKDEFNRDLQNGTLEIIKSTNEIKIQSNIIPHNNEQLYKFLLKNFNELPKFLDTELGWNVNIFENELDYIPEKDWIVFTTIGNISTYFSWISLNSETIEDNDEGQGITELNYKNVNFYITTY